MLTTDLDLLTSQAPDLQGAEPVLTLAQVHLLTTDVAGAVTVYKEAVMWVTIHSSCSLTCQSRGLASYITCHIICPHLPLTCPYLPINCISPTSHQPHLTSPHLTSTQLTSPHFTS